MQRDFFGATSYGSEQGLGVDSCKLAGFQGIEGLRS